MGARRYGSLVSRPPPRIRAIVGPRLSASYRDVLSPGSVYWEVRLLIFTWASFVVPWISLSCTHLLFVHGLFFCTWTPSLLYMEFLSYMHPLCVYGCLLLSMDLLFACGPRFLAAVFCFPRPIMFIATCVRSIRPWSHGVGSENTIMHQLRWLCPKWLHRHRQVAYSGLGSSIGTALLSPCAPARSILRH